MAVKLQPPSGTELPAFNPILPPAAVTQILLLANPNKVSQDLNHLHIGGLLLKENRMLPFVFKLYENHLPTWFKLLKQNGEITVVSPFTAARYYMTLSWHPQQEMESLWKEIIPWQTCYPADFVTLLSSVQDVTVFRATARFDTEMHFIKMTKPSRRNQITYNLNYKMVKWTVDVT